MTGPAVLLHAASRQMVAANAAMLADLRRGAPSRPEVRQAASVELHHFTVALLRRGWRCYWYVLDPRDIASLHLRGVHDVATGRRVGLSLAGPQRPVDALVARVLGTVEGRRKDLARYLAALRDRFSGVMVNDPPAMLAGLRKDYLQILAATGAPVIPTAYFGAGVTYALLADRYRGTLDSHLIKPVTGELGNSVAALDRIDETWLRRKQPLVGGWLVQPVIEAVWAGEYQLQFIGERCVHSDAKAYHAPPGGGTVPDQNHRTLHLYEPDPAEITLALRIRRTWRDAAGVQPDVWRMDFFKTADGSPVILELETVNPGFGMNLPHLDHRRRTSIAVRFEEHLRARLQASA